MEDLFSSGGPLASNDYYRARDRPAISKQWFNLLLETNAVPTIWIANSLGSVEAAFLRRFSYVVELGDFTASQRRRAWRRHLQPEDAVSPEDVEALVSRFELSAAHISGAVRAARLMNGTPVRRPSLEAGPGPAID